MKAVHQEPVNLTIDIPGYNENVEKATMNLNFDFDQEKETLVIHCGPSKAKCPYNKVWLLQHDVQMSELENYAWDHDVNLRKDQTFTDQENFLNLSGRTLLASIACEGMTFNGVYSIVPAKKAKRDLDQQMVPLDDDMVLDLAFKINNKAKDVVLTLRNPIPMNRQGTNRGYVAFVADDIVINIKLGRCKDADSEIQTIQEYENMFTIAEEKLIELKKSPSTMRSFKDFILRLYGEINIDRFANTGCDEIEESYENLMEIMKRIEDMNKTYSGSNGGGTPAPEPCNTKSLNEEIKSTTARLNNLVNDWSLASDAATKADKKAEFDAIVKSFDNKLNSLPSGCKGKLDAKLLKNYEFVKKLVK